MPIISSDKSVAWDYARKVIKWNEFQGIMDDNTSGVPASLGTGAANVLESAVAAAELANLAMITGDEVYHVLDMDEFRAAGFDLSADIWAIIKWESAKAGAIAGNIWQLDAKGFASGIVRSDAKVAPDVTITFPTMAAGATPGIPLYTATMPFKKPAEFAADKELIIAVTLADDGDAGADETRFESLTLIGQRCVIAADGIRKLTHVG